MKIPFFEEFEVQIKSSIYFVETSGEKEWDEDGRVFTSLNKLIVTDELGNTLDDTSDVYNEIQEHVLYSKDFEESLEEISWEEENIYG